MVSKREYKNLLNFIVLQACLFAFSYLAYCFFKDWVLFDGRSLDVPLHATIGLAAHFCFMTCGICLINADSFCARPISPSSRMTLHGCVMLFAVCNSMFAFFYLPYVVDYLEKVTPQNKKDLKDTLQSTHATFALVTIILEFFTISAGYFLYKCRSIMDIKRSQRVYILWLHYILGYATYALGVCTLSSGLYGDFNKKDIITKYYTLTSAIVLLVGFYILVHLVYKVVRFSSKG